MPDASGPTLSQVVRAHARRIPTHVAIRIGDEALDFSTLDRAADRVARALLREGLVEGDVIAAAAPNSVAYLTLMIGATRIGAVFAPLPASAESSAILGMLVDSGAKLCFVGPDLADLPSKVRTIVLTGASYEAWLGEEDRPVEDTVPSPGSAATIIYSSGTTGTPKGIVQPHSYRSDLLGNAVSRGYDGSAVTLLGTPLYSNTTLASLFPTIGAGGTVILMSKFDAGAWLALAETHRVTHAMLVPVMFDRILAHPDFATRDLSSFKMKYCTSAPFSPASKRAVLDRWPGGLTEVYGMTEGGAAFILRAHEFPDKLHTVGLPAANTEFRILDENNRDVAPGGVGEVVGRARTMMLGYHNRPDATADCRWTAPDGVEWQRTGDIGKVDEDGFLILVDRKKDMIISGGFNLYPADIEAVLDTHPGIREAAVVGVPDARWGETPVAFVVTDSEPAQAILEWANARLGKMQRVADVVIVDALPRGPIGKVLKRELRDRYSANPRAVA